MGDNADSHELLAVVAAVHHERVGQALNDWALGLPEALNGIATGRVGEVDGLADLDVVAVVRFALAQYPLSLRPVFLPQHTDRRAFNNKRRCKYGWCIRTSKRYP